MRDVISIRIERIIDSSGNVGLILTCKDAPIDYMLQRAGNITALGVTQYSHIIQNVNPTEPFILDVQAQTKTD